DAGAARVAVDGRVGDGVVVVGGAVVTTPWAGTFDRVASPFERSTSMAAPATMTAVEANATATARRRNARGSDRLRKGGGMVSSPRRGHAAVRSRVGIR